MQLKLLTTKSKTSIKNLKNLKRKISTKMLIFFFWYGIIKYEGLWRKRMTEYCRVMRTIRKKRGENLSTMADKMGCTMAFLSAMEVGKRLIPDGYLEKIIEIYELSIEEQENLAEAIIVTNKKISIDIEKLDQEHREISLAFARKINHANQKTLEELRKILIGDDKDKS